MLTTTRYKGHYRTNTLENFFIWKDVDGCWSFSNSIDTHWKEIGFCNWEVVVESLSDATKTGSGFKNKKSCVDYIEKTYNPLPNWTGRQRNKTKNNKEFWNHRIKSETGYDIEYWDAWIRGQISEITEWACDHFNVPYKKAIQIISIRYKPAKTRKARRSFASGGNYVSLRPYYYMVKEADGSFYYNEYSHIEKDEQIGEFRTDNPHKAVLALIVHEIAHIIVHRMSTNGMELLKDYSPTTNNERKGHWGDWQTVYYVMREKFVNNM